MSDSQTEAHPNAPKELDSEMWVSFVENYLYDDPEAQHCAGAALAFTIEAVEQGGKARTDKIAEMHAAIERIFHWTPEHQKCVRLFELFLVGVTTPHDELIDCVEAAIEGAEKEQVRALELETLAKEGKHLPPVEKPTKAQAPKKSKKS
jgi:hypothetical protein